MTYTNICVCLDGYWEKPWSQLPKEQRQAWHEALGSLGGTSKHDGQVWDDQDVRGRRYVAEIHDIQHDPAMRDDKEGRAHKELGFWRVVARDFGAVDWDYWLSLQSWTPRESACLLTELDPREYDHAKSNINPLPLGLVGRIADIERRAEREQKGGRLRDNPSPGEWAEWAYANDYALPRTLRGYCTPSSTDDIATNDVCWNYITLVRGKEREIAEWEGMHHHGMPSEAKLRDDTLTRLRAELEALKQAQPGAVSAAHGSDGDAVRSVDGGTAPTNRTEARIAAIVKSAQQFGYDPLSVPYGGKSAIERDCLERLTADPCRFTADTFKSAWQAARNAGRINVENVEIYRGQ